MDYIQPKDLRRFRRIARKLGYSEDEIHKILYSKLCMIAKLPIELHLQIVYQLDPLSIKHLCSTSRYFRNLTLTNNFWKDLAFTRYGPKIKFTQTWRQSFMCQYKFIEPLINLIGLKNFLDIMVHAFFNGSSVMTVDETVVNPYRVILSNQDRLQVLENDFKLTKNIYDKYTRDRKLPLIHNLVRYRVDFCKIKSIFDKLIKNIQSGKELRSFPSNAPTKTIIKQLEAFKQDTGRFLSSPIPGLFFVSVTIPQGINYNYKSLLCYNHLNIFETEESSCVSIVHPYIDLFNILQAIMNCKTSKTDFKYEKILGVTEFDPVKQKIILDVIHRYD